jgi:hypothetical protein
LTIFRTHVLCFRSSEFGSLGVTGHTTTPQKIYVNKGDVGLTKQWFQEYPEFNKNNIRTHKAVEIGDGANYHFVAETHPVTGLLFNNQDQLGVKMDNDSIVNGYYRVNSNLFDDACKSLKSSIFDKMVCRRWGDCDTKRGCRLTCHECVGRGAGTNE